MTKATNQVETLNSGTEAIMCIFFPKVTQSVAFFLFVLQIIDRGSIQQVGSEHGRSARLLTQ